MNEKVLHVSCGGLGYGGVSSVILSIVESLHDTFEFGCVVFNSRGGREKIFEKYGNIYRINAYSVNGKRKISEIIFRPFRLYSGIKRICRDNHYDVIHCHNNTEEGICLLAAKHAGIPIRIAHSHNTTSPKKRPTRNLRNAFWTALQRRFPPFSLKNTAPASPTITRIFSASSTKAREKNG